MTRPTQGTAAEPEPTREVTAADLTDEEIRTEWGTALDRGDRDMVREAQLALGFWRSSTEHLADDQAATERREARARIAAAINARRRG